jgi:hypothetical protein
MLLHASPSFKWLLVSFLLATAGCGANLAPVLDVQNAPVITAHGVVSTPLLVRDAIVRALASRTWQIVREEKQEIEATVSAGGHSATALVQFDERSYSITRVSSSPGLKYDGTRIHRRYNHWIDRLRASINEELGRMPPPAPVASPEPGAPPPTAGEEVPAPPPPAAPPAPPAGATSP